MRGPAFRVLYWEGGDSESIQLEGSGNPWLCRMCRGVAKPWRFRLDNMQACIRCCGKDRGLFRKELVEFVCLSPCLAIRYRLAEFANFLDMTRNKALTEEVVIGTAMKASQELYGYEPKACGVQVTKFRESCWQNWLRDHLADLERVQDSRRGRSVLLVLDANGEDLLSLDTGAADMLDQTETGIKNVLVVIGGPSGMDYATQKSIIDIGRAAGHEIIQMKLPGGLQHSNMALADVLRAHDRNWLLPALADYLRLGPAQYGEWCRAMRLHVSKLRAEASSAAAAKLQVEKLNAGVIGNGCDTAKTLAHVASPQTWRQTQVRQEIATPAPAGVVLNGSVQGAVNEKRNGFSNGHAAAAKLPAADAKARQETATRVPATPAPAAVVLNGSDAGALSEKRSGLSTGHADVMLPDAKGGFEDEDEDEDDPKAQSQLQVSLRKCTECLREKQEGKADDLGDWYCSECWSRVCQDCGEVRENGKLDEHGEWYCSACWSVFFDRQDDSSEAVHYNDVMVDAGEAPSTGSKAPQAPPAVDVDKAPSTSSKAPQAPPAVDKAPSTSSKAPQAPPVVDKAPPVGSKPPQAPPAVDKAPPVGSKPPQAPPTVDKALSASIKAPQVPPALGEATPCRNEPGGRGNGTSGEMAGAAPSLKPKDVAALLASMCGEWQDDGKDTASYTLTLDKTGESATVGTTRKNETRTTPGLMRIMDGEIIFGRGRPFRLVSANANTVKWERGLEKFTWTRIAQRKNGSQDPASSSPATRQSSEKTKVPPPPSARQGKAKGGAPLAEKAVAPEVRPKPIGSNSSAELPFVQMQALSTEEWPSLGGPPKKERAPRA
eukprot:TRINITY_DN6025_c0_g1_i1.p1 TRINITY_DN6025_c0_g1~~TRINITY_DN6025_c0_g1_i1.p1  ORF type:complete len:840 (-),score=183.10 TRINITY_DN6025_c0_g1_i1:22-2517(-)